MTTKRTKTRQTKTDALEIGDDLRDHQDDPPGRRRRAPG